MIDRVSEQNVPEKDMTFDEMMKLPDKVILVGIFVLLRNLADAFAAYLRKPS